MIQLWAWVPDTGMPNNFPAITLLVEEQPPMYEALLAAMAPSIPCARLRPNSITGSPFAASVIRAAFVATRVWKLIRFSKGVSSNWHWIRGPTRSEERRVGEARRGQRWPAR